MEKLKKNQPSHNHKHGTLLETRRVTRFTRSGINKTSYCPKFSQYLEARDRTVIEMANAFTETLTGSQMDYGDLIKDPKLWETCTTSIANELGRLAQGVGERMPTGSDTVTFISKDEVSKGKFSTYAIIVCKISPKKIEIHRTRLTVGGNLIKYLQNASTPTSDISTVKSYDM